MLRPICFFLLALCCVLPAQAHSRSLRVGARIGPVAASAGEGFSDLLGTVAGYSCGLTFSLPIEDVLWLQAELLYTRKGYIYPYSIAHGEIIRPRVALDYLDIPVVMRFIIRPGNVHIDLGGYVGSFIGGSVEAPVPIELESISVNEVGMVLGAGIDFTAIGTRFGVDLRYFGAFTNDSGEDDYYPLEPRGQTGPAHSHTPDKLNHVLSLTASFFF